MSSTFYSLFLSLFWKGKSMKINKVLNLIQEDKVGHRRLVSSIFSMMKNKTGKTPSRERISNALYKIGDDKAFLKRIKAKSRKYGNDGYYWNAIRKRVASSL